MAVLIKQSSSGVYLGQSAWVTCKEEAIGYASLAAAMEWCVREDLGGVCFIMETDRSEVVLDPFDLDDNGEPRTKSAHTARIMLENAVLRRETEQLGRVMDAILMQAKERRKRTFGDVRHRGTGDAGDSSFDEGLNY